MKFWILIEWWFHRQLISQPTLLFMLFYKPLLSLLLAKSGALSVWIPTANGGLQSGENSKNKFIIHLTVLYCLLISFIFLLICLLTTVLKTLTWQKQNFFRPFCYRKFRFHLLIKTCWNGESVWGNIKNENHQLRQFWSITFVKSGRMLFLRYCLYKHLVPKVKNKGLAKTSSRAKHLRHFSRTKKDGLFC